MDKKKYYSKDVVIVYRVVGGILIGVFVYGVLHWLFPEFMQRFPTWGQMTLSVVIGLIISVIREIISLSD